MDSEPRSAGDPIPQACRVIEVRISELRQLFNAIDPSPFNERDLDPRAEEFIVEWAKDLPRGFDVSGNFNVAVLADDLGRYTEQAHSVSVAHDLAGGWGMYWEGYGFITSKRPVGQAWTVNTGISHGIGGNAQFDVEVGHGVSAAAPDWFMGVGFGVRTAALRRVLQ